MSKRSRTVHLGLGLGLAGLLQASSAAAWSLPPRAFVDGSIPRAALARRSYARVVQKVAGMPEDGNASNLVNRTGLQLLNVLWEDTGRWEGSSVGPNISDVTIEVQMDGANGETRTALMPVMRYANFTDKTGDVPMNKLMIPVGNQGKDGDLSYVSLRDFLAAPTQFMALPDKGIDQGAVAARAARPPRAGQRPGDVPADPAAGQGDVLAGDLQLPVVAQEPGGPDAAGDAARYEHDDRRQRARHAGRRHLGSAAVLQQERTARAADGRAPVRREGVGRDHERRVGRSRWAATRTC